LSFFFFNFFNIYIFYNFGNDNRPVFVLAFFMGFSLWYHFEVISYEFVIEEGVLAHLIFERSGGGGGGGGGSLQSVFVG
jgi:hypothetical protein